MAVEKTKKYIVSTSGGKDSTATLLLAIERVPKEDITAVFADTGNEHEAVYEYLDYLESFTGIKIHRLRQDFSEWWWRRRDYVRDVWPNKGVSKDNISRVLAFLEKGPTGNPFLDLSIIKGRFPSRTKQFCTQFLKKFPLVDFAMKFMKDNPGTEMESWQGVRAEESESRAKLPEREEVPEGWTIYRPILKWNVDQVFAKHRMHGIDPNRLYKLGMTRVGCMPCINVKKGELYEISRRFPKEVARVREWEQIAGLAAKNGLATFFTTRAPETPKHIDHFIEWSKTSRGGQQYDLLKSGDDDEPLICSSSYGLCE